MNYFKFNLAFNLFLRQIFGKVITIFKIAIADALNFATT